MGSRGSSRAAVNCSVSRIRWSNCRTGKSPASLERGAGETSISTGRDGKKSNDKSGTDCKLMRGLRVGVECDVCQRVRRNRRPLCWIRSDLSFGLFQDPETPENRGFLVYL